MTDREKWAAFHRAQAYAMTLERDAYRAKAVAERLYPYSTEQGISLAEDMAEWCAAQAAEHAAKGMVSNDSADPAVTGLDPAA